MKKWAPKNLKFCSGVHLVEINTVYCAEFKQFKQHASKKNCRTTAALPTGRRKIAKVDEQSYQALSEVAESGDIQLKKSKVRGNNFFPSK